MRVTRFLLAAVGLTAACSAAGEQRWQSFARGEGMIARSDGPALFWRVLGNGPDTVVVVPGGVGLHHAYLLDPLVPLVPGRTLIYFDFAGRGRSAPVADSTRFSAERDLDDLEAVRRHFRLERMTLIGHHWGAAVAGRYAGRNPQRVTRLLLLSPFPVHYSLFFDVSAVMGDSAEFQRGLAAAESISQPDSALALCSAHWSLYFAPIHMDAGTPYRTLATGMCNAPAGTLARADFVRRQVQRSLGQWAFRNELAGLVLPVLVVEAGGTAEVERAAVRWAQHLPDAKVVLVKRPYLFPWVGDPIRFYEVAETFLRGEWPSGAAQPPRWSPG